MKILRKKDQLKMAEKLIRMNRMLVETDSSSVRDWAETVVRACKISTDIVVALAGPRLADEALRRAREPDEL